MSIEAGSKAPAFSLLDHAGERVSLAKLKGRWIVLYFYPKDDTPGCTVEACEFTSSLAQFHGLEAEVFGVSPDTPASHAKFREKHKLKVQLLADPEKKMLGEYGAWGMKKMYGREVLGVIRSTVIVDPKGVVAHHWKSVRAAGHAEYVRERLAELQADAK